MLVHRLLLVLAELAGALVWAALVLFSGALVATSVARYDERAGALVMALITGAVVLALGLWALRRNDQGWDW
jgi:membrane protein DedA with SNARE-associated domain